MRVRLHICGDGAASLSVCMYGLCLGGEGGVCVCVCVCAATNLVTFALLYFSAVRQVSSTLTSRDEPYGLSKSERQRSVQHWGQLPVAVQPLPIPVVGFLTTGLRLVQLELSAVQGAY